MTGTATSQLRTITLNFGVARCLDFIASMDITVPALSHYICLIGLVSGLQLRYICRS